MTTVELVLQDQLETDPVAVVDGIDRDTVIYRGNGEEGEAFVSKHYHHISIDPALVWRLGGLTRNEAAEAVYWRNRNVKRERGHLEQDCQPNPIDILLSTHK